MGRPAPARVVRPRLKPWPDTHADFQLPRYFWSAGETTLGVASELLLLGPLVWGTGLGFVLC